MGAHRQSRSFGHGLSIKIPHAARLAAILADRGKFWLRFTFDDVWAPDRRWPRRQTNELTTSSIVSAEAGFFKRRRWRDIVSGDFLPDE
jgi:hypothetical protein